MHAEQYDSTYSFLSSKNFSSGIFIYFSALFVGAFAGYFLSQHGSTSISDSHTELCVPQMGFQHVSRSAEDTNLQIQSLSSRQFSCNSQAAYEKLTKLHQAAKSLESRHKKGEANRARTATIGRKFESARAAETAFRSCVGTMMPEVLSSWDNKLKLGKLDFQGWDDEKEKENDGITFEVLEKTADSLDASTELF